MGEGTTKRQQDEGTTELGDVMIRRGRQEETSEGRVKRTVGDDRRRRLSSISVSEEARGGTNRGETHLRRRTALITILWQPDLFSS
jgi:hypothetical protein